MVTIYKSENGVEVCVFDNGTTPFRLDLYMRRFGGGKSRRIQAFHADLTPEMAETIANALLEKAEKVRDRTGNPVYDRYKGKKV